MKWRSFRTRVSIAAFLGLVASILIISFAVQQRSPEPARAALAGTDKPADGVTASPPPPQADASPSPSETMPSATASSPGGADSHSELLRLLGKVSVDSERPQARGYDRDCSPGAGCVFGPAWTDDSDARLGHNGCDTRNDVLRKDLVDIIVDRGTNGCVVRSGTLHDPYTGASIAFLRGFNTSRAVEIDHVIPLAAAWDMGASTWSLRRRIAFANDVDHELIAVDGPANQQKSDSTPASWLPPNKAYRCEYGIKYLQASLAWKLSITQADKEVLALATRTCT